MEKLEHIQTLLKGPLAEKGYEVLQVRYIKSGRPTLQFLIDRLDEEPVTIKDCTQASRLISVCLDVEDPIPESYFLEVSSPGVDRPLVRLKDYVRFKGHPVKFELCTLFEGQKRFKGTLRDVENEKLIFDLEPGTDGERKVVTFSLEEIYHCKLSPLL